MQYTLWHLLTTKEFSKVQSLWTDRQYKLNMLVKILITREHNTKKLSDFNLLNIVNSQLDEGSAKV